jgi:hypothetical protein
MMVRWANGIHGVEVHYCFPWAMGSGMPLSAEFIALTICSPEGQMASATAVYYLSQQVEKLSAPSLALQLFSNCFAIDSTSIWAAFPCLKRNR